MKTELQTKPILKAMYAWNAVHAGSFLLHVNSPTDCYKFIFLPGPVDYFLTHEDFEAAIKQGVLEFVEILPEEIYQETILLSCPSRISTLKP
jgi:hypothetical protein